MRARGFTLVEAIVVIVMLGIIAGLTAPRLVGTDRRRAETAAESVAGVLGVIAQRETLGTVRMALAYDPQERAISLERLELPTDDDGRFLGLSRRDAGAWRPDPLAPEVTLGPVRIDEVRLDGLALSESAWRIEFVPGEARPLIEMDLVANIEGVERTWRVELLPFATEADKWSTTDGARRTGEPLRSSDLEALGLSDVPW
ncbi:MAG: prepilin-type N-terminal cleavage/methylation domain-containing protein [Planctomycetota bacterium]